MFGEQDFVQYWTAFQLFVQGHNPYDIAATRTMECALGHDCNNVLVSWNPPWLLLLMAPVLWLPFSLAAKAWFFTGLIMAAVAALLVADCYEFSRRTVLYALVGVFFNTPLLLTSGYGQTGALLLFASALLLHGRVKTGSGWEQAAALVIMSIKPHLFFLVGVALLWDELRSRRVALIAQSAGILLVLVAPLMLINPAALPAWMDHFIGAAPGGGAVGLTEWKTSTVSNLLRMIVWGLSGNRSDMLLFAMPGVAVLVLLWWLYRNPILDGRRHLLPLLALSLWLAPYGWAYDWAALGILQAGILCRLSAGGPNVFLWLMTGALVAAQSVAGYLPLGLSLTLDTLVWLPAVHLLLCHLAGRIAVTGSLAQDRA